MKSRIISICLILVCIFFSNVSISQSFNISSGSVESYVTFKDSSYDAIILDTITGHFRSIAIDTINNKVGILWQIDSDTMSTEYNIEKIYQSENYNQTTQKQEIYSNILSYDNDRFPMLVVVSGDLKTIFLYFYYSRENHCFMKGEKISISKIFKSSL